LRASSQKLVRALMIVLTGTLLMRAEDSPIRGWHDQPILLADATHQSFQEVSVRAQAALDSDRIPEAIRLFTLATTLRPDWTEGWWHLGTLLFDTGQFGKARDAFAQFVTIERKEPGPGFGMLGLTEFELKHYSSRMLKNNSPIHRMRC
jgi:Flp pilus assembly protein TadD